MRRSTDKRGTCYRCGLEDRPLYAVVLWLSGETCEVCVRCLPALEIGSGQ